MIRANQLTVHGSYREKLRLCRICHAPLKASARQDHCNSCFAWNEILVRIQECRQYRGKLR